ncbi:MAG: TetR family transcriptional regulator [Dokdonella sp.]
MNDEALTPQRILEAAEDVLRRYGPAKATVVDVARALGVSHGSVYRHFASKAALRDAVVERWLARSGAPLAKIAADRGKAAKRLRRWFDTLIAGKREKALGDAELFATYYALTKDAREIVKAYADQRFAEIETMIAEGIASGDFRAVDAKSTALALWNATTRFHNPTHASEWEGPDIDAAFDDLWTLLMRGLAPN